MNEQEEEQNEQEGWAQEPSQQGSQGQQQQQPYGEQQSYREQQQPPQYYHPGQPSQPILGKKSIMAILVVSMLLIAISAIWLSIATVPDYDKINADDREKRSDNREDFQKGTYTAQTVAGILATIGTVLGGIISLYAGLISKVFEDEQKKAMIILAGFFLLGLVFVVNHFPWTFGGLVGF